MGGTVYNHQKQKCVRFSAFRYSSIRRPQVKEECVYLSVHAILIHIFHLFKNSVIAFKDLGH